MSSTYSLKLWFRSALGRQFRSLCDRFNYDFVPKLRSPRVEDFLFETFRGAESVTFLQVGAHDGTQNDPASLFRCQHNWKGILLEPNPSVFKKLKHNLSGQLNQTPLNVALAEKSGTLPFYIVAQPEAAKWPIWADQVSSFSREHVEKMMVELGQTPCEARSMVHEVQVETKSFDELLDLLPSSLDLLLIDAEGADFFLLRTFPFDRQKPTMIIFEHVHLTEKEMMDAFALLTSHGYSLLKVGWDIVAVLWR